MLIIIGHPWGCGERIRLLWALGRITWAREDTWSPGQSPRCRYGWPWLGVPQVGFQRGGMHGSVLHPGVWMTEALGPGPMPWSSTGWVPSPLGVGSAEGPLGPLWPLPPSPQAHEHPVVEVPTVEGAPWWQGVKGGLDCRREQEWAEGVTLLCPPGWPDGFPSNPQGRGPESLAGPASKGTAAPGRTGRPPL